MFHASSSLLENVHMATNANTVTQRMTSHANSLLLEIAKRIRSVTIAIPKRMFHASFTPKENAPKVMHVNINTRSEPVFL